MPVLLIFLEVMQYQSNSILTLNSDPSFLICLDYSLMKIPQNYNLQSYRFPTQGKSYISVPGEALTMQCEYAHVSKPKTLKTGVDPCPDPAALR